MKTFNCILGVLSVFGSIYCIAFPGVSFLNGGWVVTVLLGAWGICSVFNFFDSRKNGTAKSGAAVGAIRGILSLAGGIGAAVFSLLAMFAPKIEGLLDIIILAVFSGWLILSGVNSVFSSIRIKKCGGGSWIFTLILGIAVGLSGIYGIFHLIFLAESIGVIIGILLMIYGVRLIASVFEKS